MTNQTYLSRSRRFLSALDNSLLRVRPLLLEWLGERQATQLITDSRQEYDALMTRIPFIGANNPMLSLLLPTTRYLAVYRGLQAQGRGIEDAGRLAFAMGTADVKAIPAFVRRKIPWLWFSHWFRRRLSKRAAKTVRREFPGDYVFTYVPGDGRIFDYGVDYIECASCKLLQAENAVELTPYVCATDKPTSDLLGWGLTRTMTLAEGFSKCDFRFKKGGTTRVELPQSLAPH
jgi:hypothetical protein